MGIERITMNENTPFLHLLHQPEGPMVMKAEEEFNQQNTQNTFLSPEFQYFQQQQPNSPPQDFSNMQQQHSPPNFQIFNNLSTACTTAGNTMTTNQQMMYRRNAFSRLPMPNGMMQQHMEQLPDTTNFPGNFNFELSLGPHTDSATKSADYTFSPALGKLYVQKGAQCPFKWKTTHAPPPNTTIKILPVYKGSHVLSEPVRRCSNHAENEKEGNPRYHFIRANNGQAHYETSDSGRLYLTMPYTGPQVGAEYQTELLSFMCFNSCGHSSHAKRRIDVIFMLENNGQVLGRQVIEVRVCACPGRDRNNEEQVSPRSVGGVKAVRRGSTVPCANRGGKRRKLSSIQGDEEFTIKTSNLMHFTILSQIQEVLESHPMMYMQQQQNNNLHRQHTQSPTSIASSPGNVFQTVTTGLEHESTDEENS